MANTLNRRIIAGLALLAVCITAIPARAQDVVAYPDTYDFMTVYIGEDATMAGSIANTSGSIVVITSWEWAYNPLNAFEVTSEIPPGTPFLPGEFLDYQVTFTPPGFSFWNATLRYHTSSSATPTVDIQFWGFGDYDPDLPNIAVWPLALDFGAVSIGDDGTQTITITNTGGGELVVNLSIPGSVEFRLPPGDPTRYTLTGGQAQDVVLLYSPSDVGDDTADLVIAHNDPDLLEDVLVPLTGTGLPVAADCDLTVSPTELEFGDVLIGNTGTLAVTLENVGPGDCTVYDLDVTGSTEFMLNPGAPLVPFQVLAGGPLVDVDIDYTPIDGGVDTGELAVGSDDPDTPEHLVSLSGSGVFSMVDLDIRRLWVRPTVSLSSGLHIYLNASILNNGIDEGDRLARLTGVQDGVTVYTYSRLVSDPVGGSRTFVRFPSYTPTATGRIDWTLVIFDDDPDDDTATESTSVVP